MLRIFPTHIFTRYKEGAHIDFHQIYSFPFLGLAARSHKSIIIRAWRLASRSHLSKYIVFEGSQIIICVWCVVHRKSIYIYIDEERLLWQWWVVALWRMLGMEFILLRAIGWVQHFSNDCKINVCYALTIYDWHIFFVLEDTICSVFGIWDICHQGHIVCVSD